MLRATLDSGLELAGNELANGLIGAAGEDMLSGGDGRDTLDGGSGSDILAGGDDADTYRVGDAGDVVMELAGEGKDNVFASIDYALELGSEVETLRAAVGSGLELAGNEIANSVIGAGGGDTLDGGGGKDKLTGQGGADGFRFSTAPGAGNVDRIKDFSAADDTILLDDTAFAALSTSPGSTLDASEFVVGAAAQDADDRIVYNGADGWLSYDADGSGTGAAVLFARLAAGLPLTADDLAVV